MRNVLRRIARKLMEAFGRVAIKLVMTLLVILVVRAIALSGGGFLNDTAAPGAHDAKRMSAATEASKAVGYVDQIAHFDPSAASEIRAALSAKEARRAKALVRAAATRFYLLSPDAQAVFATVARFEKAVELGTPLFGDIDAAGRLTDAQRATLDERREQAWRTVLRMFAAERGAVDELRRHRVGVVNERQHERALRALSQRHIDTIAEMGRSFLSRDAAARRDYPTEEHLLAALLVNWERANAYISSH